MSDNFLRELDEEVRRDKAADLWRRYGSVIVGVLIVVVLAVAGWRFWQYRQEQSAQAVSVKLEEALKASRDGRSEEAEKALAALGGTDHPGYRVVTRFRLAAEEAKRDVAQGITAFDALAGDPAVENHFRDLARLRSGLLRLDTQSYAEIKPLIEPVGVANGSINGLISA